MASSSLSPRARYREQTRAEIKEAALQQLAEGGIPSLALTRIAKGLGLSGPALYRYFDSRDALLNELIRDAYDDLAGAVRAAAAGSPPEASPRACLHALADACRAWAQAQPHRYLLIEGTPVPGYTAPSDTLDRARAVLGPFLVAFRAAEPAEAVQPVVEQMEAWAEQDSAVAAWVADNSADKSPADDSPADNSSDESGPRTGTALAGAVLTWSHMHGAIGLEVAGQFHGMGHTGAALLTAQIDTLADAFHLA